MEKHYDVAVLGATGAVGREMIRVLEQRDFPVGRLRLLAGARSAGRVIRFRGREVPVEQAGPDSFRGCELVLGAADSAVARQFAPHIRAAGAVFVDNSSAFRLEESVPLVVPEVNGEAVREHRGIIANPNCCTIIVLTAVGAIHRLSPITALRVCTYQAVSGAGAGGLRELEQQLAGDMTCRVFPAPILGNLIPRIGEPGPEGETAEERKLRNEGRRILSRPGLAVDCTCVRVPVARCHSMAVTVETESPVSPEEAAAAIAAAPGCRVTPLPMPLDASGGDHVLVGRIRKCGAGAGLTLWCCGDQLRKGAALNAVQILEALVK